MLFRGRQPAPSVWRRFRSGTDDFTFARAGDHYEARIAANAERVVDLLHALSEQLPPAVDVAIEDLREEIERVLPPSTSDKKVKDSRI